MAHKLVGKDLKDHQYR